MKQYKTCSNLSISNGAFLQTPIEFMHNDVPLDNHQRNDDSSITFLQFKKCHFSFHTDSPLQHISARYRHLQTLDLSDCTFGNTMYNIPYETKVELLNTTIDKVLLYQSDIKMGKGLVYNMNDTLFISIVTSGFSKRFICTSSSRGSRAQEVEMELWDVFKDSMYHSKCACFVQIHVQSIKTLVFKVENKQKNGRHFDITISFPS